MTRGVLRVLRGSGFLLQQNSSARYEPAPGMQVSLPLHDSFHHRGDAVQPVLALTAALRLRCDPAPATGPLDSTLPLRDPDTHLAPPDRCLLLLVPRPRRHADHRA